MPNLSFNLQTGQDNVIRVPISNPGGITTGRLLVDTGNGLNVASDVVVTVDGGYATMTIPAAVSSKMANARWVLQAFDGPSTVEAARGQARLSAGPTQSVSGTVELGTSSLSDLETISLSPESLGALETVSLGPSSAIIGHTSTVLARKVAEGKVFIAGAAITLGGLASTDRACLQVVNPATSTRALYIFAMTVYSSITQQVVYMEDATMGGTPTTMTPFNINRAHPGTSLMTASYSTAAPAGGEAWPNQSRVQSSSPLNLQFPPIVLPPNKSLLIRGTVGDAQTFTANAYWFEE